MPKRTLGINVLTAAQQRLERVFDDFPRICVSFSAGKDSTVLLHLAAREARRRNRKIGVLLIDLEAQYQLTIQHALFMYREYADVIEPYWIALPLALRNAVSNLEPKWMCWEPGREQHWVRKPPPFAITDHAALPFFRIGMEFEEFTEEFNHWYARGQLCCQLVGIRTQESLNRWRAIARADVERYAGLPWTTWKTNGMYNAYPLYDWSTEDIWVYHARTQDQYNAIYDRFHQAGLSIHQMRICQPYGDDQRKGLWLFHIIEPETWARVVARVSAANSGALYARESGNVLGRLKITKPEHLTWEGYAKLLLETMPAPTAEHYRDKISVFLKWWEPRGYGVIPDAAPSKLEVEQSGRKQLPSWERIVKVLLVNDYWCKRLSFNPTGSQNYTRYKQLMAKRRAIWNLPI